MNPIIIIANIVLLYEKIEGYLNSLKTNRTQCYRLAVRLQIVVDILRNLKNPENKGAIFLDALNDLERRMRQALELVQLFTDAAWYQKALRAKWYQRQFDEINGFLAQSIQQLDLGVNVQQLMDREQDRKDQAADFEEVQKKQDEILRLSEEEFAQVKTKQIEQAEQQKIMRLQLGAVHCVLAELSQKLAEFKSISGTAVATKVPELIDARFRLGYHEITFQKVLAEGELGTIYLGTWNGQTVAIKALEGVLSDEDHAQFMREVQVMSHLQHAAIIQFYGASLDRGRYCLVMEYAENESLRKVLHEAKTILTPEHKHAIALEVAQGLSYLHSQGVVHCNLDSGNVLLDKDWHAKLSDFGLSKTSFRSVRTVKQSHAVIAGMAPELFEGRDKITPLSDVYSYGVLLWELMTGKVPYAAFADRPTDLVEQVKMSKLEAIPADIPEVYANIIRNTWQSEPAHRMPLTKIIEELSRYVPRPITPPEVIYEKGCDEEQKGHLEAARKFYERAAEKGFAKALTNLGFFYLKGDGGCAQDKKRAFQLWSEAATKNHARAQFNLGMMFEYGDGIDKDLEKAREYYVKAAANGHPKALERLGHLDMMGVQSIRTHPTMQNKL